MLAYEAASRFLRYQRHPVRYTDLNRRLLEEAREFAPQVVLIVMGFHISPETLHAIKRENGAVLSITQRKTHSTSELAPETSARRFPCTTFMHAPRERV